ncbi:MAG: hypothetical protein QOJ99_2754 [Bryobacterales bacterium]|jgi:hypothetical protein|nr:hypothetical protein [Bryobacterales bacterium]
MRIDESHRGWAIASAIILAVAVIGFVPYALYQPGGPGGNTWPGLLYGVLGYSMMLYAGLMGARKKRPLWRVGRAQAWMRGHLWMGALSVPMILLHSAFAARGPLTLVLMTLLVITVLSGVTGALLQHFVPKRLTASVPMETIYEQIPEVREQLRQEASGIVEGLCQAVASGAVLVSAGSGAALATVESEVESVELTEGQQSNIRLVYNNEILPFLRDPDSRRSPLASAEKANSFFDALRRQLPLAVHEPIGDLESICAEERQLTIQKRKYLLLHAWLLVHVPLSITLLVLGGIHALVAIHY